MRVDRIVPAAIDADKSSPSLQPLSSRCVAIFVNLEADDPRAIECGTQHAPAGLKPAQ